MQRKMGHGYRIGWIGISIVVMGWLVTCLFAQEEPREPVATMQGSKARIEWFPLVYYEKMVLTVSGEGGLRQAEFTPGTNPSFELHNREGEPLPDGTYSYELSVVPKLDENTRRRLTARRQKSEGELADGREAGDAAVVRELRAEGAIPRGPLVQSGSFSVRGGLWVDRTLMESPTLLHERPLEPKVKNGGDLIVWGDLTVRGVKSSAALDPKDPKRSIYFATLEGPEVGTYFRGSAKLAGGEAVIQLPAYFSKLTDARGLTVQITPVGAWSQLYVAEKSLSRLVIRQAEGDDRVGFDFLVQGVRKGHTDFKVERESGGDDWVFPELAAVDGR